MSSCGICFEDGLTLLKTVCAGSPEQTHGKKHEPVICFKCMYQLCVRALADFLTPKCPVCRRQIFLDCLVALGWKNPAQFLVDRFKNSVRAVDMMFRAHEGLATHDVLTSTQMHCLYQLKRPISDVSNLLGFLFMYCALQQFVPGPVYDVERLDDDSFWTPKSNTVFYTLIPNYAPRTLLLITWNGPHHGVCVRITITETGSRIIDSHTLPFFSPICIMRRRQKLAQLDASRCTRARTSLMQQHFTEVQSELYHSMRRLPVV